MEAPEAGSNVGPRLCKRGTDEELGSLGKVPVLGESDHLLVLGGRSSRVMVTWGGTGQLAGTFVKALPVASDEHL